VTPFRIVLILLCVAGTVLPLARFIPWLSANDWDMWAMITAWQANGATQGLLADLMVAAATLTIWVIWESAHSRNWVGLLAIPATFGVGLSLGLPLYLLLRRA
jgi:hypothetical protein